MPHTQIPGIVDLYRVLARTSHKVREQCLYSTYIDKVRVTCVTHPRLDGCAQYMKGAAMSPRGSGTVTLVDLGLFYDT